MKHIHHLDRPILIDVCKDGTVSYRDKRDNKQKRLNGAALPVFSVDTVDEARQIQVRFCRLQYTEHPKQPGRPWYVLNNFSGELAELDMVTADFATFYAEHVDVTKKESAKHEAWQKRDAVVETAKRVRARSR